MNCEQAVLDASAVLAFLQKEKGSAVLEQLLIDGQAWVSAANYAEIISKLTDIGIPEADIKIVLENLELKIVPLDEEQALATGQLRKLTKRFALSLGDRACIALGEKLSLPIITCDKQWSKVKLAVEIIQLR